MRKFLTGLFTAAALGSGTPLLAEESDLFTKLDVNKDGFVTDDEVDADKKPLFERLLRNADANDDKKLDKEEFAKGTKPSDTPKPPIGEGRRPGAGGIPDVKEFLKRLDKNEDGKIDKEEAPPGIKQNFDRLDDNKDGAIDADELGKMAGILGGRRPDGAPGTGRPPEGGAPSGKAAEEMFDRQDANSDGKLTKDEIPEERRPGFERMLERFDTDGDGSISKEQFVKGMLAMAAGGRPPEGAPPGGRPGFGGPGTPGGMPPLPVLKALDADGDGEISKEEIEGASKALTALDKNGDGKLTRDEILPSFAGGFPGGRPEGRPGIGRPEGQPGEPRPSSPAVGRFNPEEMLKRLKEADANGVGKLSKEEAPDRIKERFDMIDTNSDGELDEAEIKAMFARVRERLGAGRPEGGRPEGRPEPKPDEKKPEETKPE